MARESALWDRCKTAAKQLRQMRHHVDLQRLENSVGTGHPDVEGCVDGGQVWIELKSCMRPARADTCIHPKTRQSQSDWHATRVKAGCRINWVLIQVGEGHDARLYLVPGSLYDQVHVPENELELLSCVPPKATVADILLRAVKGWGP